MRTLILFAIVCGISGVPVLIFAFQFFRKVKIVLKRDFSFDDEEERSRIERGLTFVVLPLFGVMLLVPAFAKMVAESLVKDMISVPKNNVTADEAKALMKLAEEW